MTASIPAVGRGRRVDSEIMRAFVLRYRRVLRRYLRRRAVCRVVGVTILGAEMLYLVFGSSTEHLSSTDVIWSIAAMFPPLVAGAIPLAMAEAYSDRAKAATELRAKWKVFASRRRYTLMLRSFESKLVSERVERVRKEEREQTILVRGERLPTGRTYEDYVHEPVQHDDVTRFLASSSRTTHVVVIDGEGRTVSLGPFVILSAEDWWPVFETLVAGASMVTIVPEGSPSLVDEISSIVPTHLGKTVFVMPPSVEPRRATSNTWLTGLTRRERWQSIRQALPIALPDYTERGAFIRCLAPDAPATMLPYSQEALVELVELHRHQGMPIAAALKDLERHGLLGPTISDMEKRAKELV